MTTSIAIPIGKIKEWILDTMNILFDDCGGIWLYATLISIKIQSCVFKCFSTLLDYALNENKTQPRFPP